MYVRRRSRAALRLATTRPYCANAAADAATALSGAEPAALPPTVSSRSLSSFPRENAREPRANVRLTFLPARKARAAERSARFANRPRLCFSMESAFTTMAATSPSKVRRSFPFFFLLAACQPHDCPGAAGGSPAVHVIGEKKSENRGGERENEKWHFLGSHNSRETSTYRRYEKCMSSADDLFVVLD